MSKLNPREHELVALGAALASNCVPCIKHHIRKGRLAGLEDDEIREALAVADGVRQVPARKVLRAAESMLHGRTQAAEASPASGRCGCREERTHVESGATSASTGL